MFVQVIQGTVKDADLLRRVNERWRSDLKPGAIGLLGATQGVTNDGRAITIARFESEDAARTNSNRPEQGAWWNEAEKAYGDDVTFHDCHEVDTLLGGGSNDAGFVQIIQGKAKNQDEMRKLQGEMEQQLRAARPDILGVTVAWHGDGGFSQAVYFKTEAEARKQEQTMQDDELGRQFMELFDGPPTFFDLTSPEFD